MEKLAISTRTSQFGQRGHFASPYPHAVLLTPRLTLEMPKGGIRRPERMCSSRALTKNRRSLFRGASS